MKSLKKTILAALIAFSVSCFSPFAFADNAEAIANMNAHINEALKSVEAKDTDAAITHTKQAKRAKGEMNSEQNAAKIGRLSKHFNKARKFIKKADWSGAKAELEKAQQGYNAIRF